jgi:mannosyltransferase
MALPKSMRYLAGATICVFVFLFVQILKAPSAGELQVPSKVPLTKDGKWSDPQLERRFARKTYRTHSHRD